MIKSMLKAGFAKFGRRYNYDTSYYAHITDVSTSAALRISCLPFISQFHGTEDATELWAGAIIASSLEGDCGPCVQLVIDMAREANVSGDLIARCLEGQSLEAGDVGLGFRFAQAAISDDPALDDLRNEIENRLGAKALVAASFAAATGRVYPVIKRSLGHGKACSRLEIDGKFIEVVRS